MDFSSVDKICKGYDNNPGHLIGILQDVQGEYRYLPKESLMRVSDMLGIPLSQVYAVATFFKAFSLEQKGENVIQVCVGTACHVRGAQRILEELERGFGIKAGETTDDLKVTLETVNCVGACALGPVVVVNGEYFGKMDATKTAKLITDIKGSKGGK